MTEARGTRLYGKYPQPPMPLSTTELLKSSLQRYNLQVDDQFLDSLSAYAELVWEWNAKINLTRHTDYDSFVSRDVLDTLRLSARIPNGQSVLDVGSGGGVPGIVLAIIRPDLNVCLAESVGKKAEVLRSMVRQLELKVTVQAKRAEDILRHQRFHVLTIRAVAPLRKLLFWFQKYPKQFGRLLLIKGPRWTAERDEAQAEGLLDRFRLTVEDEYLTPGHDNNSVILAAEYIPDVTRERCL